MRRFATTVIAIALMCTSFATHASAATVATTYPLGIEPFGVTIDPRDGKVFVAISDHNNWYGPEYMWAIDPASPPPWDSPPRFQLPRVQMMSILDISLDRLFVSTNDGLTIVDPHTHAVLATVALGGVGVGLALDAATHHVYVATLNGAALVDGTTGAVLARRSAASTTDAWWHIAHDPVRHRVFVTNGNFTGSPSLVVLDDADLSLIANIALPAIPRLALTVDVARGLVYVGGFSSGSAPFGSLYAIDESSLQIVKTLDVGDGRASPFSTTLVGDTLYVSVTARSGWPGSGIVVVDATAYTISDRISLSFQPGQTALHPDGRLYVAGHDARLLAAIDLHDHAPRIDSVSLDPASPATNDMLRATVAAHDAEGDPFTLTYQWTVNGVTRTGETGPMLDLSRAGNGDRSDLVCITVNLTGHIGSDSASRCVRIADTAPAAAVALDATTPTTNATVRASVTATDADADTLAYTYTWTVNGVARRVVSSASTTDGFDLSTTDNGDRGDVVAVSVVASDGTLQSAPATASVTVANSAPTLSVSLSDSSAEKHVLLVATSSAADADGDTLSLTFTWRINGSVRQTTTGTASLSSSFDLRRAAAKIGDRVTVDVTLSDGAATAAASASATVTPAGH